MKVIYPDCETTGLWAGKHEIFQFAAIIEINGIIKEEINLRFRPENWDAISPEALEVTKKTVAELKTYPSRSKSFAELKAVLKKYVSPYDKTDKFQWIGQNPKFDTDFVRALFKAEGDKFFGSWFAYPPLDLITLAAAIKLKGHINPENFKLGTLCKLFGIELDAHDALNDVRATRAAFLHIMKKYIMPVNVEATV